MLVYRFSLSISKQIIGVLSVSSELSINHRMNCSSRKVKILLSNLVLINKNYRWTIATYYMNYWFNYRLTIK